MRHLTRHFKSWRQALLAIALALVLVFAQADGALAARTGGRIGGGSFRMPSSRPSHTRVYSRGPDTYRGGYGGGIGFPFLLPLFGFGGFSSLFSIFLLLAIASFLVRTFRTVAAGTAQNTDVTSVAKVQVGLLAGARDLQSDLDNLARTANTETKAGRSRVLQESTLALLRHPEYWVYAHAREYKTKLEAAEAKFNQFSIAERMKFSEETLSNVEGQVQALARKTKLSKEQLDNLIVPSAEYIVVTLIVGCLGSLEIPPLHNLTDLQEALRKLGAIPRDDLLAMEVLWTPQDPTDTLTSEDLLLYYPDLRLI